MIGQTSITTTESHQTATNCNLSQIDHMLENENLVRKEVSKDKDSLFIAFSDGLYFTPTYYHQIKDKMIRYLFNLITTHTLPSKLGIFRGNSVLWNDYSKNPSCQDFLKINLELFSLVFNVRVVVYTMTTDGILTAKIFNNKFDKTIQFINTDGAHLDVIYKQKTMQAIGICQNIVMNMIEWVLEGKTNLKEVEWKDFNNDKYINTWLSSESSMNEEIEKKQEETTSPTRKRVRSEPDLKSLQMLHKDQLQHYEMFVGLKPSEEISKKIQQDVSKLNQPANLNTISASSNVSEKKESSRENQTSLDMGYRKSLPEKQRVIVSDEEEELAPPETIKLEKSKSYMDPQQKLESAVHFTKFTPPGLTPNRYSTKTYGADTFTQAALNSTDAKPIRHRFSESYSHGLIHEFTPNGSNQNIASNPKTTTGTIRNLGLSGHTEEFNKNQGNAGIVNQGTEGSHQISRATNPRTSEKKKPVIIDESQHRYTGKLKFFDEGKNYGFIVMDDDGSDIFVHFDDLHKANINKDTLKAARFGNAIKLSFNCMEYIGKYNRSRKATDIQLIA